MTYVEKGERAVTASSTQPGTSASSPATPVGAEPAGDDSKPPRRINVAVTPEAIRGIEQVIENEGVTLTEAVRRLLNYGHFVYDAVKENGGALELTTTDGTKKDVVFV